MARGRHSDAAAGGCRAAPRGGGHAAHGVGVWPPAGGRGIAVGGPIGWRAADRRTLAGPGDAGAAAADGKGGGRRGGRGCSGDGGAQAAGAALDANAARVAQQRAVVCGGRDTRCQCAQTQQGDRRRAQGQQRTR